MDRDTILVIDNDDESVADFRKIFKRKKGLPAFSLCWSKIMRHVIKIIVTISQDVFYCIAVEYYNWMFAFDCAFHRCQFWCKGTCVFWIDKIFNIF